MELWEVVHKVTDREHWKDGGRYVTLETAKAAAMEWLKDNPNGRAFVRDPFNQIVWASWYENQN